MQRDEIRLECLKLVFRRDRHPNDNVTDAKLLEAYVASEPETKPSEVKSPEVPQPKTVVLGRKPQKAGNLDILS